MKIIKVKQVKTPLGDCATLPVYYRERYGMPLLAKSGSEWVICSKDGEPSHAIGADHQVEIVNK